MTATTLSRSQRAMQITMRTQSAWTASVVGMRIPSQTVANRAYNTTLDHCDCPDSIYRVGTPNGPSACKHSLALRLAAGRMHAAAPTPKRESDDAFWARFKD